MVEYRGWWIIDPETWCGDVVVDSSPDRVWTEACPICGQANHHLIDVLDCERKRIREKYGREPIIRRTTYRTDDPEMIAHLGDSTAKDV
jgi:hypothetical protein